MVIAGGIHTRYHRRAPSLVRTIGEVLGILWIALLEYLFGPDDHDLEE